MDSGLLLEKFYYFQYESVSSSVIVCYSGLEGSESLLFSV